MADFSRESMLDMFIFEMNQLLDQLEQLLIECEDGYSMDNINEIFRIMHTVKGSSAMMLYEDVSKTAHVIEDLFFYLREENPTDVDYSGLTDLVLEGMDYIKNELGKIANGEEPDSDPTEIIKRIKSFLALLKGDEVQADDKIEPKKEEKIETKTETKIKKESTKEYHNKFECQMYFDENSNMENVRSFGVINNLKDFGDVVYTAPEDVAAEESEQIIKKDGFRFIIATDISYEEIHEKVSSTIDIKSVELNEYIPKTYTGVIHFDDGCEMENIRAFTLVHNIKNSVQEISHVPEDIVSESSIDEIRKNGFKIRFVTGKSYDDMYDILMGTIFLKTLELEEVKEDLQEKIQEIEPKKEEIAPKKEQAKTTKETQKDAPKEPHKATQQMISVSIGKLDQLLNLMGELVISEAMTTQNPDLNGLQLENFSKSARQLRKIIKSVQDSVMSMRMVTLDATFFKMQRIVRDMCKALGKNINLIIEGRDTEVDKNIIEHIADPLMHIIRNSVDHGVEVPEKRVKAGKEEQGTIILEARNSGGEILISVKDDGAGINKQRVMEKAISAGILKKPAEEYTDREIYQLIFHAGLSTKETVTNFSGRGVGMDVVTANIESVGGSIVVESEEGLGTTTVLKIPLTLAIIEGMLIGMGGAKYTIPISAIQETFKAKEENIFLDPDGNEMITLRGDVYNLIRLYDFFHAETEIKDIEEGVIIILESDGRSICLFVDELIGEQQVVVKNIPKYIKRARGISGCTLLGNGDISLIVDVVGFFDD